MRKDIGAQIARCGVTHGATADVGYSSGLYVERAAMSARHDHVAGRNELIYLQRFERVVTTMNRRLDQPLTNSNMADVACLSPCHFNRLFRHTTGIPPVQFHYALRLDRAKRLLMTTDLSITEICFEVGYNSLGTFTSRFNQLVGLSPSAFRHLTRKFFSTRLSDLSALLPESTDLPAPSRHICGAVSSPRCDGLIFLAMFPRAVPEGFPAACAFTSYSGSYSLPNPGRGVWHIFAVAVPWNVAGMQLFTLDGLCRGRSGPIRVEDNGWSGESRIELMPARILDPPVLSPIPVLLSRLFAARATQPSLPRSSTGSRSFGRRESVLGSIEKKLMKIAADQGNATLRAQPDCKNRTSCR
jgi:AraC-like DNA-binding protein